MHGLQFKQKPPQRALRSAEPLYILAGNKEQATIAARWLGLPTNAYRLIGDVYDLDGTRALRVLLFGTYYGRADYKEMLVSLRVTEARISILSDIGGA